MAVTAMLERRGRTGVTRRRDTAVLVTDWKWVVKRREGSARRSGAGPWLAR
jgi:hypothetical protein